LHGTGLRALAPLLALCLAAGGCVVASSRFEVKARETETLRDALASVNKEKSALEARNEALEKRLADEAASARLCAARVQKHEEETRKLRERLDETGRLYEGSRITREQLIAELLEKEKASGKRIQELSARAQICETEGQTLRAEAAALRHEAAELREKMKEAPDQIALQVERDILLGRVERLTEERTLAEKRRDDRFAALARDVAALSPEVTATFLGPALRLMLPGRVLTEKGKPGVSAAGRAVVGAVGKAASEFPTSSVIVTATGKPAADEILALLTGEANLPAGRVLAAAGGREKGAAELVLLVP
jgi:hypothetical protein